MLFSHFQEHNGRSGFYQTEHPFSEEAPGNGRYEVPLCLPPGQGESKFFYVTIGTDTF